MLDQRAIKYNFDLPNGSYDVTFGFKLPSGWGGRTMDLTAEGTTVGTAAASNTALEKLPRAGHRRHAESAGPQPGRRTNTFMTRP